MIGSFQSSWDEVRRPLPDEAADAARRARYWEWSNAEGAGFGDDAKRIASASDGRYWVRLESQAQADFEAYAMQHSIGYNFEHYSEMGDIYSLRDGTGRPTVTILVADGTVVHARRPSNAALWPVDAEIIAEMAAERGWKVAGPDRL